MPEMRQQTLNALEYGKKFLYRRMWVSIIMDKRTNVDVFLV